LAEVLPSAFAAIMVISLYISLLDVPRPSSDALLHTWTRPLPPLVLHPSPALETGNLGNTEPPFPASLSLSSLAATRYCIWIAPSLNLIPRAPGGFFGISRVIIDLPALTV
jgi:hypothetical protein